MTRLSRYLWDWLHFIGPNFRWEWLASLPPIVVMILIFLFHGTEPAYRIGGGILQVIGVASVFWGVY